LSISARKFFDYSWLVCRQPDDLAEEAQETLLKAFESFHQLSDPEQVRGFFRIARVYRSLMVRDLEEWSTEETAQVLDLTADAVKTRLHRARTAMRQKLDGYLNNRSIDVEPVASPGPLSESEGKAYARRGGR
jgi:DNA-directed RNA polymerase specialized sigma24 family protein